MYKFKKEYSLEKRQEHSRRLMRTHADRIPVIIDRVEGNKGVNLIDKTRYLVPHDSTIAGFMSIIRQKVVLNSGDGFYMFCGDKHVLVSGSNTFHDLYLNYKDEDGFLYMLYAGENVFG